ncbi:MAG: MogA/MoaB family molybdenum cofactor biosynthesis protein [Proteobacteria bacterium]|nr:MogA/MoaB family molybdenum cofactor biosynthesis protein [Pseudomonadota bacterium]
MNEPLQAKVLVSSDRASDGLYDDLSGPAAYNWLENHGFKVLGIQIIPDDRELLSQAIGSICQDGVALLVTSGGTGLGSRDVMPQVLDSICDYAIPGFGELLRRESLRYSLNAYLSRCGGWVKQRTLILALPGNPRAVCEQLDILSDLLPHALKSIGDACNDRRPTPTVANHD